MVGDAELRNPRIALDELIARLVRIEDREQVKLIASGISEKMKAERQIDLLVALQQNAERAEGRHEDQKR